MLLSSYKVELEVSEADIFAIINIFFSLDYFYKMDKIIDFWWIAEIWQWNVSLFLKKLLFLFLFFFFLFLLSLLFLFLFFFWVILAHKDQSMQSQCTSCHGTNIDGKHHVIIFGWEGLDQLFWVEVGK